MIGKPITGPGQLGPCRCSTDKCEAPVIMGRQTPCLRDEKTEYRNQRLLEENCTILRREIAEMQELCDDLSSTVIAAAFLAPHGNGAKALLDEAIERMATRARRKVGGSEAVK